MLGMPFSQSKSNVRPRCLNGTWKGRYAGVLRFVLELHVVVDGEASKAKCQRRSNLWSLKSDAFELYFAESGTERVSKGWLENALLPSVPHEWLRENWSKASSWRDPWAFLSCKKHQAIQTFWIWKDSMTWRKRYLRFRFLHSYQCLSVTFAWRLYCYACRSKNFHSLPSCAWWPAGYLHENFWAIVRDNADISLSSTGVAYIQ